MSLLRFRNETSELRLVETLDLRDRTVDATEVRLFYRMSQPFTGYLVRKYGEDRLWSVVRGVGQGLSFDDAFAKECGIDFLSGYDAFLRWYY